MFVARHVSSNISLMLFRIVQKKVQGILREYSFITTKPQQKRSSKYVNVVYFGILPEEHSPEIVEFQKPQQTEKQLSIIYTNTIFLRLQSPFNDANLINENLHELPSGPPKSSFAFCSRIFINYRSHIQCSQF